MLEPHAPEANTAIRSCFVDTLVEFRCIRRVSQERFHDPASRFPSLAPAGDRSPASSVLSRRYDFLPPIPPRFVAFAWRYLSVHSLFSLPGGQVHRRGQELVTRYLRREITEETTGSPKFLGNRLSASDHYDVATWPLMSERQRLPQLVFRSSIAWLSD